MTKSQGGCLCGKLRYEVSGEPIRTTFCHCTFCQRATGAAYMVQPVFAEADFAMLAGVPKTYTHISEGSGKEVYVHFCDDCGTKLYLTFQRFSGFVGVYYGTFDSPNAVRIDTKTAKHIFLGVAQRGTAVPPHVNTFTEHAVQADGTPNMAAVFETAHIIE